MALKPLSAGTTAFKSLSAGESKETMIMRQAGITAAFWLDGAIEVIDDAFGRGYAKAHPELVGAFIQTAAIDELAMTHRDVCEGFSVSELSNEVKGVALALETLAENTQNISAVLDANLGALKSIASTYRKKNEL